MNCLWQNLCRIKFVFGIKVYIWHRSKNTILICSDMSNVKPSRKMRPSAFLLCSLGAMTYVLYFVSLRLTENDCVIWTATIICFSVYEFYLHWQLLWYASIACGICSLLSAILFAGTQFVTAGWVRVDDQVFWDSQQLIVQDLKVKVSHNRPRWPKGFRVG